MLALLRQDIEFIVLPRLGLRNKTGKDAGIFDQHHGIAGVVPAVEIADDGNGQGMRRPDGKRKTGNAPYFGLMGTELFVDLVVGPFSKQISI